MARVNRTKPSVRGRMAGNAAKADAEGAKSKEAGQPVAKNGQSAKSTELPDTKAKAVEQEATQVDGKDKAVREGKLPSENSAQEPSAGHADDIDSSKEKEDGATSLLPQNIVLVGERIDGNKKVYIHQKAYKAIHRFAEKNTTYECGGILVGKSFIEDGKLRIDVFGFIEAKNSSATTATFTLTHESWNNTYKVMEKKYPDAAILGWMHTHPDFGVFLSENDTFIHQNYFNQENQIAYVVDPVRGDEGMYCWQGEKLERCSGFYVYDEVGVPIAVGPQETAKVADAPAEGNRLAIRVLGVLIALLFLATIVLSVRIIQIQSQVDQLQSYLWYYSQVSLAGSHESVENGETSEGAEES